MVKEAYVHLRTIPNITMARFGSEQQQASTVLEIVNCCKLPKMAFASQVVAPSSTLRPRILITGAVTDAEALSACQTFQILVQRSMQVQVAVVRSPEEMEDGLPFASYVVVLFSRGMLRDPSFAKILLSAKSLSDPNNNGSLIEAELSPGTSEASDSVWGGVLSVSRRHSDNKHKASERNLKFVTVSADAGFEYPSLEFYEELELHRLGLSDSSRLGAEAGPELAKAYRSLLSVLSLPLSSLGSIGLLETQVSEICRRFRKYRDSAVGLALDQAADDSTSKELSKRRRRVILLEEEEEDNSTPAESSPPPPK
ncbi:unnamed protein product [Polarella glacialis]|uniref:Uncharacterized protein n=2 Tax=Polarella glacialis TaxID=89957 RepID=A0A813LCJ1_POLGL|nr:unnamed protein product [Polarella glacialis]